MKCVVCGNEINDGASFCTNCASLIKNDNNVGVSNVDANANVGVGPSVMPIDSSNINSQNMVNNTNAVNINNNFNNKKKGSKLPFIIIGIVIALILIAATLYLFVFNRKSSKDIFVDGFKNVTNELFKDENIKRKSVKNTISYNIDASGMGMDEIVKIYNNLKLSNNVQIDTDLKKLDEEISFNYKDNDLFSFGIYGRDNSVYLGLTGLYDKYIKLPITEKQYSKLFNSNTKGTKVLKSALDTAFEKSLDSKYFTKNKRNIDVAGKTKKYNAYTLTISNDNIKEITKNFINNLISNEEFISYISSNYGIDKASLNKYVSEIDYSNFKMDNEIMVTIFTSGIGDAYRGVELSTKVEGQEIALRYVKVDNNNSELTLDMGITSFKVSINKTGDDNNTKTTITADLGVIKMSMIDDMVTSNNVEFKDIDTNKVIEYDYFVEHSDEILNSIENNTKLKEFMEDFNSLENVNSGVNSFSL